MRSFFLRLGPRGKCLCCLACLFPIGAILAFDYFGLHTTPLIIQKRAENETPPSGINVALPMRWKWLSDHDLALEKMAQEKKPLLLAFLGSGWCPWSDKLAQEVIGKKEFTDSLGRDFVLLRINCSGDGAEPLKERYGVEQCPCFILIDSSGEKIAQVEYLALDSGAYASHIKALLADFRLLKKAISEQNLETLSFFELKDLYKKATRLANDGLKNVVMQAGIKVDPGVEFLLEEYQTLVSAGRATSELAEQLKQKISTRDPDNTLGSQLKLAILEFERLIPFGKEEEALHPLFTYIQQFGGKDPKSLWQIEMMISQYFFGRNQMEKALKHAKASYEAAPQESKSQVVQAIEYLQKHFPEVP